MTGTQQKTVSIIIPFIPFPDFQLDTAVPSEEEILWRDLRNGGLGTLELFSTGVNMNALAYAVSQALSTSEVPTIGFEDSGGYNTLYKFGFQDGKKVIARIPSKRSPEKSYIESSVATMCFARYVRNIPTPEVFAWNATHDHIIGVPFIIQEYVDNVIEPWRGWVSITEDQRSCLFNELAKYHSALLVLLPYPLHGVGNLVFAPSLPANSALSDPRSYMVRPLRLLASELRPVPFVASSVSLSDVWQQLWSHHNELSLCDSGSRINRDTLFLDDDEECDITTFTMAASQARTYAESALRMVEQHPQYAQPCLVNYDYAFRNILIDPKTYRIKAFIDWDDVHVMPFVVGVNFPEDIKQFIPFGLAPDADYYREGEFSDFPPNEHGTIVGAVGPDGKLTGADQYGKSTGVDERDERIRNTTYRERYIEALQKLDPRIAHSDMWGVRRIFLKAHALLKRGGAIWWSKRQWLNQISV